MSDDQELREAVEELHQYLSDRVAPLMVADSLALLLQHPAQMVASQIQAWAAQQRLSVPGVSVADFIFHAVKKVALVGEFELVAKDSLGKYLEELGRAVLQYCPEADRELLRQNLDQLGHAPVAAAAAPVALLHRQAEAPAPAAAQVLSQEVAQGLRRLSLFLERLQTQAAAAPSAEQRVEVASQFMTAAAVQSSNQKELEQHLAPLRELGIDTEMDKVFRTLARSLPGWGNLPAAGGAVRAAGEQLNAMRQIVSLADDPAEGAKRFRELVHAAVEQFNEGHLGRAVTMFQMSEQLVADQKVKPVFVEALRKSGHEYLDAERLRKLAERVDCRPALRTILDFFLSLQPEGLLRELDGEPKRERRHELLALLEVHGAAARAKARELLKASLETEGAQVDPFFQMNLVYLLRVIPRPEDVAIEDEVNLIARTSGRSSPPPLVKQVIAYLAQTRHEKAERALITYLRVFENMLLQPETAVYTPEDVEVLLDRTCGGLARYATPRAWRALVDHGLKAEARLGSTLARLAEAGRQDLSASKDLVDRMIAALKAELPRTVLGFTVKKSDDRIVSLIQALSGTPTPEVRGVLQEIVDKHPGQKFAEAASKALAGLSAVGKAPEPPAGLTGDLELFGLPGLLQTLSQSQLTGVLSLLSPQGKAEATMLFERGHFRGAQSGNIRGADAVYEVFEKPFPGSFAFVSRQDLASQGAVSPALDVLGLILEGVRRHDEFRRAAALVPDGAPLRATGTPSTPLPDEDEDFAHYVWKKASSGTTAAECEASITTDSYRVRRLLAHWVEEGALKA